MKDKLVIYGTGSFARMMKFYFTEDSNFKVVAFTVDQEYLRDEELDGLPVIPFETITTKYPPEEYCMFVAIGYKKMRNRKLLFDCAMEKGYQLINYVNSNAIVYNDLVCGCNNVIMGNVNIEPGVSIGDNNILWSDTLICHDAKLGSHNYLSPKCLIGGFTVMNDLCFLGNGSSTIDQVVIGLETYLIAGTIMFGNTTPFTKYLGNPGGAFGRTHEKHGIVIER